MVVLIVGSHFICRNP